MLRVVGPGSPWPWLVVLLGFAALVPFARAELAHPEPLGVTALAAAVFLLVVHASHRPLRA